MDWLPDVAVREDGQRMVRVPLDALNTALGGAKAALAEKKALAAELAALDADVLAREAKLHRRQEQLDRCASFRHNLHHRPTTKDPSAASAQSRSKTTLLSSATIRDLLGDQAEELDQLLMREENLRALMDVTREVSQKCEYLDIVSTALRAARNVIEAEKYTLGILSAKKDSIELFSNPPVAIPGRDYMEEGTTSVDSTTTFGRVVLTGTTLEVDEVNESDVFDLYEDQLDMLDFEPQALLCVPIFNVHGVLVGVFQVITQKRLQHRSDDGGGAFASNTSSSMSGRSATSSPLPRETKTSISRQEKDSFYYICVITGMAIWNMSLARAHQVAQSRIECLLKLNRNISAEIKAASVLDQIVSVSYELLSAEKIVLYVRDEGTDEFYIASGVETAAKDEYHTDHNGIAGFVMRTGQLVLTNSAQEHPEFDPSFDEKSSFVTRQVLCTPVKDAGSTVIAVVCASNKADGGEFTSEDALYLNYAADAASISLHKSNLLREVVTSQRITEARLKLTDFVSNSTSVAEFVNIVVDEGKKLMGCDRFGFLLVDQLKKELWITQIDGQNVRMPMNKGISGLVATTGEIVCTRDAYTHELFDPSLDVKTGYRTTSVLCMPVFEDHTPVNPKIVAVAMCINKKEGARVVPFTNADTTTMSRYCREIQFALGRLSLDISYYKVVSDCGMTGDSRGGDAAGSGMTTTDPNTIKVTSSLITPESPKVTEAEIVSSIVHKFCQMNEVEGIDTLMPAGAAPGGPGSGTPAESWMKVVHQSDEFILTRENGNIIGVGDLDRWDFNCLDLSNADIFMSVTAIFRVFGFLETFHIHSDKFATFLSHVASHYRPNPFHNLQHAFQVTHATYIMVRRECGEFFSTLDIFTMLVAALCHDIDHPGNNNDFEIKSLSQMALTHNDDAVLERHHCRVTFIILSHQAANILENLPRDSFLRARRLIIHCILATDMSKHFDKCKVVEGLSRRHLKEKRYMLMAVVLHAADLSGQALPYEQSVRWGMRVLTEFQNQAKSEVELKVPVDSYMTNLHQMKSRVTVQMNFINYVLRPIWLPLATLCPQLRVYADALESNFESYKADLDRLLGDQRERRPPVVFMHAESSRQLVDPPSTGGGGGPTATGTNGQVFRELPDQ